MGKLKSLKLATQRPLALLMAVAFGFTLWAQLSPQGVNAAQITARKIVMSTSAASAAATYALTFTPVTTEQELVVDFCANDPLISDTCTFAAGTVPTIASPVSSVGTATAVGSGSPVHTIKVTGLTMTGGSPFTVTITSGITNPTTNTSFYARILTYPTGSGGNYIPANTSGNTPTIGANNQDSGGIALSTAANINITSKVFETLSFCVFQTSCGTAPTLTLGDPTTQALSISNAYANSNAQFTLATNAGSGVNVTMTGTTLCRPGGTCTTGANAFTISATGGGTGATSAVGTEQFGMCAWKNGSTALTVATKYLDSVNACSGISTGTYAGTSRFGFDDSAAADGTNNAAGTQVMSSTGAVPTVTGAFTFLGNIAATTEAGVYSTNLNLVATGTF
jgi:hypothetical protein